MVKQNACEPKARIADSGGVAIASRQLSELTPFAASVDVTGAANGWTQCRVDGAQRNEVAGNFGRSCVSDRTVDRPDESVSCYAIRSVLSTTTFQIQSIASFSFPEAPFAVDYR